MEAMTAPPTNEQWQRAAEVVEKFKRDTILEQVCELDLRCLAKDIAAALADERAAAVSGVTDEEIEYAAKSQYPDAFIQGESFSMKQGFRVGARWALSRVREDK